MHCTSAVHCSELPHTVLLPSTELHRTEIIMCTALNYTKLFGKCVIVHYYCHTLHCTELPHKVLHPYIVLDPYTALYYIHSLHHLPLSQPRPFVAMLLDAADVVTVAEHLKQTEIPQKPVWLIGRHARADIHI